VWKGDGGKAITSFAIVTTDAAPSVSQYHNRMPVAFDLLFSRGCLVRSAPHNRGEALCGA
jgi:hypothetical protein